MFTYNRAFSSFSVKDIKAAKEFYGDVLGVKVEESEMGLTILQKDKSAVFLYPKKNHKPATFTVLNFVVDDIEETVDELTNAGIEFEQYTGEIETDEKGIFRGGGPRIAWFKDPSGNILSIHEAKQHENG